MIYAELKNALLILNNLFIYYVIIQEYLKKLQNKQKGKHNKVKATLLIYSEKY